MPTPPSGRKRPRIIRPVSRKDSQEVAKLVQKQAQLSQSIEKETQDLLKNIDFL